MHENSVLKETRGASPRVLCTRYYYGGAVRAGHVARMEKWEEDGFGVERKLSVFVGDVRG